MQRLIKYAMLPATAGLLAAGCVALLSLNAPYRGFPDEIFVRIERGAGAVEVGRVLAQAGVIRGPWQFWAERALHRGGKIQAGEYRFDDSASPAAVFARLARGDVYYFEFTVK